MTIKSLRIGLFSAAAGLAVLALTVPVLAGGPLIVFDSGQAFLWPGGGQNIPFNPDQGGLGTLNNPDAVTLTEDAFLAWEDVPTSTASYLNAGLLPVDVDETNFGPWFNPPAPDGLSAIVYDEDGAIFTLLFGPGSGILGFAGPEWINLATGEILEGVSFINGEEILAGTLLLDTLFSTLVHEFGHYTNLAHTVTNGEIAAFGDHTGPTPFNTFPPESLFKRIETMYPFLLVLPDGSDFGDDGTPHPDDIAILSTLYPEPNFFTDFGTVTGTILAPDGVTRLTGVNVIARNVANPYDDAVSALSSDFSLTFFQSDPFTGVYTLNGLTPGSTYAVFVDQILAGGFSTPPLFPLPGPEEFHNGTDESADSSIDDPSVFTGVASVAGLPTTGIDIIFNAQGTGPGDPLPLGDDDNIELFLPFTFSFCGVDYNSLFVNSNGSISFGVGSNDFSESAADMLNGSPRIAGYWDDLNPSAAGVVTFDQTGNTFSVFWTDVPEFPANGANTFSITLHRSSDQIDLAWESLTAEDGLAGLSCGGQATLGQEPSMDLSELSANAEEGIINSRVSPAIYELWTSSDPNDVVGSSFTFSAPKEFVDRNEPNNSLAEATRVSLPFSSGDQIGDSPLFRFTDINPLGNDVDFFEFNAFAGETLTAETVGNTSVDTLIGLFDATTGDLLATDDDGGASLLSKLVFPIPADGSYALAVTTFPDFDFTGAGGDSGRYVLEMETIEGITLDLGDDDTIEVSFDNFDFPFQEAMWSSVFVNSNGNLTFGSGDTDFSESVSEFLNEAPRIAPLWDDLSPNNGGQVMVERTASSMTIEFENVPEFFSTGANTFSVTMNADGTIEIVYGDITATDGLTGVTEGSGATDPGSTDLSTAGSLSATGTTYELFDSLNPVDLSFLTLPFL